jgi:Tfp pilus assembly protein PilF
VPERNAGAVMDKGALKALVSEARRLRAQENWGEEAINANTRILTLDPANVAALNRRARCYREGMDLIAAERDYRRALELSPTNAHIEGALREIQEEAREARDHEKRVEEIRSLRSFAQARALGRTNKDKPPAKRRLAVEAFRQAFRLDKSNTDVLIELAAVHRSLRQRDEAERI